MFLCHLSLVRRTVSIGFVSFRARRCYRVFFFFVRLGWPAARDRRPPAFPLHQVFRRRSVLAIAERAWRNGGPGVARRPNCRRRADNNPACRFAGGTRDHFGAR